MSCLVDNLHLFIPSLSPIHSAFNSLTLNTFSTVQSSPVVVNHLLIIRLIVSSQPEPITPPRFQIVKTCRSKILRSPSYFILCPISSYSIFVPSFQLPLILPFGLYLPISSMFFLPKSRITSSPLWLPQCSDQDFVFARLLHPLVSLSPLLPDPLFAEPLRFTFRAFPRSFAEDMPFQQLVIMSSKSSTNCPTTNTRKLPTSTWKH